MLVESTNLTADDFASDIITLVGKEDRELQGALLRVLFGMYREIHSIDLLTSGLLLGKKQKMALYTAIKDGTLQAKLEQEHQQGKLWQRDKPDAVQKGIEAITAEIQVLSIQLMGIHMEEEAVA